jgi:hypothetical protein
LEENDNQENKNSWNKIIEVGELWSIEGMRKSWEFIGSGENSMEKGDDRSFVFVSERSFLRNGRKRFPDNSFTDVDGNEKRNTGISDTVPFL